MVELRLQRGDSVGLHVVTDRVLLAAPSRLQVLVGDALDGVDRGRLLLCVSGELVHVLQDESLVVDIELFVQLVERPHVGLVHVHLLDVADDLDGLAD